jgi:hypothetical protein
MERENKAFKELINSEDIEIVTPSEIHKIVITREPKGKFIAFEIRGYIAVDNSTYDAWTEFFTDLDKCMTWFKNKEWRENNDR